MQGFTLQKNSFVIDFDPSDHLIFAHTPKTAGSSVNWILRKWFDQNLYLHYKNGDALPHKLDLDGLSEPAVIYGHFNAGRGFGVERYYPQVKQFITILREPLELQISRYYFIKERSNDFVNNPNVPDHCPLEDYVRQHPSQTLQHFPRQVTFENYAEIIERFYIEIGVTERLEESLKKIATKLGKPYQAIGVSNSSNKNYEEIAALSATAREKYRQDNALEYEIYNYVLSKYT